VNYYKKNALQALTKIFAIIALAAIVLLAEYYYSIRKLKAIRKDVEENSRHKI
jgi:acyl-CoA synthetase (AMP-forming)/AMP-acid ligase II